MAAGISQDAPFALLEREAKVRLLVQRVLRGDEVKQLLSRQVALGGQRRRKRESEGMSAEGQTERMGADV